LEAFCFTGAGEFEPSPDEVWRQPAGASGARGSEIFYEFAK